MLAVQIAANFKTAGTRVSCSGIRFCLLAPAEGVESSEVLCSKVKKRFEKLFDRPETERLPVGKGCVKCRVLWKGLCEV